MKKILSLAVAVFMSLTVFYSFAADNDTQPLGSYWFVGAKGGIQIVPTDYDHAKLITPAAGVQFGRFITPTIGLRLDAQCWQSRGGLKSLDFSYDFKYVTGDIDLLLNLTNIFSKNKDHNFNTYFIAGVGAAYAWDNDELTSAVRRFISNIGEKNVNAWNKHSWSHNFRLGLACDYNFTRNWAVNLEVDANSLSDRFNSKINNNCDWQLTAMAGVTFKFVTRTRQAVPFSDLAMGRFHSHTQADVVPANTHYESRIDTVWYSEDVIKEEIVTESILRNIHYAIRQTELSYPQPEIDAVVDFVKNHKDCEVTVIGHADKKTGTPAINMKYSMQRADNAAKGLIEAGVPANIIETMAKGDTVQPFSENDLNRVVIIEVLGKGTKQNKETVRKYRLEEKK
jgi:outer membrane protein OmpA-like peptidoglycan-associated protein